MASEKYSLAWNEFQTSACTTFSDLYENEDFADVTLACDDGNQIEAHKVILSSCSIFFRTVFKRNRHQHPLLYLKGIRYEDLQGIIKFIYCGKTEVDQEYLDSFMTAAKELKINGLSENLTTARASQTFSNVEKWEPPTPQYFDEKYDECKNVQPSEPQLSVSLHANKNLDFIENSLEVLDDSIEFEDTENDKSTFDIHKNVEGFFSCDVCEYQTPHTTNLEAHRVSKHSTGYSCEQCKQTFSSRGSLTNHKRAVHEGVRFRCDFQATYNYMLKKHKNKIHY